MTDRRKTRRIHVGAVPVGGGADVSIQSMTNTPTSDAAATAAQIESLARLGCEIVRVSVPDAEAADALPAIVRRSPLPVIADIHFDYRLALRALEAGVAGLRINPGNIGSEDRVRAVVRAAAERSVPIRIGVNAGSLEKALRRRLEAGEITRAEAMVESALGHVRILEQLDFHDIKISMKASDVLTTVAAYRLLATRCDYPFHVGITEAGTPWTGTIKSSAGIGILLMDGLCDTIRVSLSGPPEEEIRVARRLLQVMDLRHDQPMVIACPTCARTTIDVAAFAEEVERALETVTRPLHVAVMGCEVNGPGEARDADVGLAGAGKGAVIFRHGEIVRRCSREQALPAFLEEIRRILDEKPTPVS